MNIFVLDSCPTLAAMDLCDKHLSKMLLESCQLMCTAKNILDPNNKFEGQYRTTHANHPCAIWTRASTGNFRWLLDHAWSISLQYSAAYEKNHKSNEVLKKLTDWQSESDFYYYFGTNERTPHPQCMPDEYKDQNTVQAYRNYYIGSKARFAKWKNRPEPIWWPKEIVV